MWSGFAFNVVPGNPFMMSISLLNNPPLLAHVNPQELSQALPQVKIISWRGPGQSGGVSKVLAPLVAQFNSQVQWIALSEIPEEKSKHPHDEAGSGFSFFRPDLPEVLIKAHEEFCAECLFPVMHGMPELAVFDEGKWKAYQKLNRDIATQALAYGPDSFPTILWSHDYQLAFTAPITSMEAGVIACQFWHVPFPEPRVICPMPFAPDLVSALLANRILGFHTNEYATNFLNAVQVLLPAAKVDLLSMQVHLGGASTQIEVMPLGLDFDFWQRQAGASRAKAAAIPKKYRLASQIVLGIDRLDYAKGVWQKLNGLEAFLKAHPSFHRRFHFVQIVQPPQWANQAFADYASVTRQKALEINDKYRLDDWEPIVWLEQELAQEELAAWYLAADALCLTPLRDGLNLVAKEYVACRTDEQGALILSRYAGSASELASGCLPVDPGLPAQIALALEQALTMGVEEKRRRMLSMRHIVGWNQLHDWALGFLKQAVSLKPGMKPALS